MHSSLPRAGRHVYTVRSGRGADVGLPVEEDPPYRAVSPAIKHASLERHRSALVVIKIQAGGLDHDTARPRYSARQALASMSRRASDQKLGVRDAGSSVHAGWLPWLAAQERYT